MNQHRPRSTSMSSRRGASPMRHPATAVVVAGDATSTAAPYGDDGGRKLPLQDSQSSSPSPDTVVSKAQQWWATYLTRLKGEGRVAPSIRPVASIDPLVTVFLSGGTLFILVAIQVWGFSRHSIGLSSMITAFGASSGMVFGATQVHASQPRGVIGGFLIGGIFGITSNNIFRHAPQQDIAMALGAALSVACALTVMKVTSLIHPPGCSAAIFSAYLMSYNQEFQDEGYIFLVTPLLLGALVLVVCGWLGNNAFPWRKHYPSEW
ncbi:integral membrane protein, putative [Bodo saltans]|uniref:Integral membrane protein, putative n=1 Tax=Bodo saltans TaxID=75058 RepID=A0A0S4IHZ9_BODSA|nr:integral membrane protein, putative [Bodo saltans]|eukprot:CUE70186.1 integral membrane protein, putative [Bodo saltans]